MTQDRMNNFSLRTIFQKGHWRFAKYAQILQWARTTAISRPECLRSMGRDSTPGKLLKNEQLCVRDRPGSIACSRDGGGGLITRGKEPVIIGVYSWSWDDYCPSDTPNVFERVFPHLAFIKSAMQ